jgi:glycine cleavage system aminomethyltransferase T
MLTDRAPVARTPLDEWHAAHGAQFTEQGGWRVVAHYADPASEAEAARAGLGVVDASAFAKTSLRGPGVPSLALGGAAPSPRGAVPLPSGLGLACRLTDDHLLLLGDAPGVDVLGPEQAAPPGDSSVVRSDVTSAYAGFVLAGPRLSELLRGLTHLDLRPTSLPPSSCAETALAGVEALLVRGGEEVIPILRVFVAWELGEYVWERIFEEGRDLGVTALGLEALGRLRLGGGRDR